MKISAVVLAAGKSSRMGKNKLLLEIDGKKILDWILQTVTSTINEVIVVTGHDSEIIKKIAENYPCKIVYNSFYEEGMTLSFQTGLKETNADAVFLILGDSFGLNSNLLKKMMDILEKENALIVSPIYNDVKGHPVLFHKKICDLIIKKKDTILKDIVIQNSDYHKTFEGSIWTTIDFDTPEDFEKVKELWRIYHSQTGA